MKQRASWRRLYATARWKALRRAQLDKQPLCEMDLKRGRIVQASVVDHVRAHKGDEALFYDAGNLQSLCKQCHDSIKQQMEKSGFERGADINGMPVDPAHHWYAK